MRVSHGKRTSNKSNRNKQRKNEEHVGMKTTWDERIGTAESSFGRTSRKTVTKQKYMYA